MADENNFKEIKHAIAEGSLKALAYHFTITYIIPIGTTLLTGAIGYVSGIPWFWVWLGMLAAFAFISNGLLRFDEWLYRRRIQDKLVFASAIVARSIHNDGIVIGIAFNNTATFPIEVEVTDIRTRLGTTVPQKTHQSRKIIVSPKCCGWYYDNVIQLPLSLLPTIEGFVEYTLKYGRPSSLKYSITGKKQIIASFSTRKVCLWTLHGIMQLDL